MCAKFVPSLKKLYSSLVFCLLALLVWLAPLLLPAQQIPVKGVPWLDGYAPADYLHHGKIWDIASAENGLTYMAGDGGLLEYDGHAWRAYRGSKGYTRSIWVASDSLIYSGSDLDFGLWRRDATGRFAYTSLYPFAEEPNAENEEFWGVYGHSGQVVFVSFSNLYLYKNQQFTKIAAPNRFTKSFQTGGNLYLADEREGLLRFTGMSLKPVFDYPEGFRIAGLHALPDGGLLVASQNDGLFLYQGGALRPWSAEVSGYLKRDRVFSFAAIDEGYLAFGSILNGLYITDLSGRVAQHLNKRKGLPNNTVLSLHQASGGLLWMGMDYGLASAAVYSSLTYFFDDPGQFGTAHTALLHDGVFYLGTNQGLYTAPWSALDQGVGGSPFVLAPGTEGQVWSLTALGGRVYCGHDRGLLVAGPSEGFRRLHDEPGVWNFLPYAGGEYLLTGHYNGISVLKRQGAGYVFHKKIELILGSCNQLIQERDNLLWVNIPNYGLIRFRLNADFYPEERKIFPAADFAGNAHYLLSDESGIQLLTSEGRYRFDAQRAGFVRLSGPAAAPAVAGLLPGVYRAAPLDERYGFYPIYNGFALEDSAIAPPPAGGRRVLIRKMEAFNNHTREVAAAGASLPYALNNLRFDFVAPHQSGARYQYRLLNYSDVWSDWGAAPYAELLNLSEGDYTFQVRAQVQGKPTAIAELSFSIRPPGYRSWPAYLAYALLLALLYYLNRRGQNARLSRQKEALLEQEQRALKAQAEHYEQQALLARQQQLEQEKELLNQQVKQKSIELAKQAKENEDKNRLLHIMKEKMDEVQHNPAAAKTHWNEIKRLLDLYLETDDHTFEIQIDELHQAFFKAMRERFPELSLYDLRLCAYLKMGLNSKEISEMLQVLPSSINVSRSRLRKKLNLLPDEDLYTFLNGVA